MSRKSILTGLAVAAATGFGIAGAHGEPYVQVAEIRIDPAQIDAYTAAVREHAEAAVRNEPGVLALYIVSDKADATHIRVFEIYASPEAYKAHLDAPHFRKYKTVTEMMVTALTLVPVNPVVLAAQSR